MILGKIAWEEAYGMSIRRKNPARIGRRLFISASVAGGLSAPAIVSAQGEWPTRQIRVVVPCPPGGPSDVTTRLVMERAGSLLGQSVLFDNKAGASGAIGAEYVKNAAADGYTFLTTTRWSVSHSTFSNCPTTRRRTSSR